MQNPDSETAKQPSSDALLDAADIMADMADGHCSIGSVPKDLAKKRRRVARWLKELGSMSQTADDPDAPCSCCGKPANYPGPCHRGGCPLGADL